MALRFELFDILDIGTEIIRKRNEENITQDELAKRVNSSKSIISRIENHKRNISIKNAEKIFASMGYKLQIAITKLK